MTNFGRNAGNEASPHYRNNPSNGSSAMKVLAFGLLGLMGVALVFAIVGGIMLVSANNTANSYENSIKTTHVNNQNILGNFGAKIATMAKVTGQYKDDFIELVKAEMAGRYGDPAKRPNVIANWVQERGLAFDSKMYRDINIEVTKGYNAFSNAQTTLLDRKREYQDALGNLPSGPLMAFWGYPKINLNDYDIVRTQDVIDTYESGVQKPLDPFGK